MLIKCPREEVSREKYSIHHSSLTFSHVFVRTLFLIPIMTTKKENKISNVLRGRKAVISAPIMAPMIVGISIAMAILISMLRLLKLKKVEMVEARSTHRVIDPTAMDIGTLKAMTKMGMTKMPPPKPIIFPAMLAAAPSKKSGIIKLRNLVTVQLLLQINYGLLACSQKCLLITQTYFE